MNDSCNFRLARTEDLEAIVAIYNASIPGRMATADTEPITVASRQNWLNNRDATRPIWVWQQGEAIAGWLSLQSFYGRPAYRATAELSIYVSPDYQRRGIGQQLLQQAIASSPGLGLTTLLAFVFAHNHPSLELFNRFGFTQWGYLPQVARLDGSDRDLIILGKRLIP